MDINFKKSGTSFKNLNRTCTFEMAKKKKSHCIITGLQQVSQRAMLFGTCIALTFETNTM